MVETPEQSRSLLYADLLPTIRAATGQTRQIVEEGQAAARLTAVLPDPAKLAAAARPLVEMVRAWMDAFRESFRRLMPAFARIAEAIARLRAVLHPPRAVLRAERIGRRARRRELRAWMREAQRG